MPKTSRVLFLSEMAGDDIFCPVIPIQSAEESPPAIEIRPRSEVYDEQRELYVQRNAL